jgi:hypothetical protein
VTDHDQESPIGRVPTTMSDDFWPSRWSSPRGDARAGAVIRRLQVASEATSLGGVETLVSTPLNFSHSLTPEERRAARIDLAAALEATR